MSSRSWGKLRVRPKTKDMQKKKKKQKKGLFRDQSPKCSWFMSYTQNKCLEENSVSVSAGAKNKNSFHLLGAYNVFKLC